MHLLISMGPVAVPDIFLVAEATSSAIDRCHSLTSLYLPPAALGSLPTGLFLRRDDTLACLEK